MAKLTLSCSEFAIELCDASCLHATSEDVVQVFRSCSDRDELGAAQVEFGGSCEAHWDKFRAYQRRSKIREEIRRHTLKQSLHSAKILSAFASEMPLIVMRCFFGVNARLSIV